MNGDACAAGSATETNGSSGKCIHCWVREAVLENMVGAGKGGFDVAAPQLIIERDIGVAATLEMLEIGESAGWPQNIVDESVGLHRLDFVIDRRQFLVFGEISARLLGNMRIARPARPRPARRHKRTLSSARIG